VSKPLHEQMLDEGEKTAPEPETAEEMHRRIARPERLAGLAGVAAVIVGLVKFLPEIGLLSRAHGQWLIFGLFVAAVFLVLTARKRSG
jgi:hypothetical protein